MKKIILAVLCAYTVISCTENSDETYAFSVTTTTTD